jgi:hypothetical protein
MELARIADPDDPDILHALFVGIAAKNIRLRRQTRRGAYCHN